MVQACNISKHYFKHYNLLHAKDGFYALRDISFTVHAGDHEHAGDDHGGGVGQTPGHGVEHGYNRHDRIAHAQIAGIGQGKAHGVQNT